MAFTEGTSKDALGGIVIRSRMRMAADRQGFEKQFFPGIEVGLTGWERAHSQGKITGVESPNAIRYAPSEVNQEFQRLGIERFIRELFDEKAPETEIWLTTVTYTHPMSLRLKEIQYRVDVVASNVSKTLFEASIEVEDKRNSPKVKISAQERTAREEWLPLIKNTEAKEKTALLELSNMWQRLQGLCELYKGEHKMQLHLVNTSVAGYLTNRLFNTLPPPIEIWNEALKRLTNARTALIQKDIKKATKEIFMARANYLFALKKYTIWKDGIESAGRNMQIAIGVVAVLAIIAATGFFVASAAAARGGAGVAAGASLAATEQATIRVTLATQRLEASLRAIEALSQAQEAAALAEYEAAVEAFTAAL